MRWASCSTKPARGLPAARFARMTDDAADRSRKRVRSWHNSWHSTLDGLCARHRVRESTVAGIRFGTRAVRWVLAAVVLLATFLAGVAVGRYSAPAAPEAPRSLR